MKKTISLAVAVLSVASLSAQQQLLRIHHADGSSETMKVTDVVKITFEKEGDEPIVPGSDKMVDMGLSVKWASWNVGAMSPEEYGNFYAYGEIEPKSEYTEANYKWLYPEYDENQFYEEWEKYYKLGSTITGTNYDVAHVKWGDLWRIPTREEWKELIDNCSWSWTAVGGVTGARATSRINGASIFLPAAGNMVGADHTHDQLGCFYWSSSENEYPFDENRNYRANIDATNHACDGYDYPDVGFSIRPVYGAVPPAIDHYPAPAEPVDLGLSVKWAPCNLGGTTISPSGKYFAWGETATKLYSHVFNYKYYNPLDESYEDIGESIGGTEYDCATMCWGEDWRLPTKEEMQELIDKCTWTRSGYDAIITGPNGNSIKLPAMQFMGYSGAPSSILSPISSGYYMTGDAGSKTWASGRPTNGEVCTVLKFYMAEGRWAVDETTARCMGMSVRPVYAK